MATTSPSLRRREPAAGGRAGPAGPALAFSNQGDTRTVTDGTRKLSYDLATGSARLFDLAADPGETTDLAARLPDEAHRLEAILLRWLRSRQLHAVGYL